MAFIGNSIGADIASLEAAAQRVRASGTNAKALDTRTVTAGDELVATVTDAQARLLKSFNETAADLNTEVNESHRVLVESDWSGSSKDAAVEIKSELQREIARVLGEAEEALGNELLAFKERTTELMTHVNTEFAALTKQVEERYGALADAADATAANFLEADRTISVGG